MKTKVVLFLILIASPALGEGQSNNCSMDQLGKLRTLLQNVYSSNNICSWLTGAIFATSDSLCIGLSGDDPNSYTAAASDVDEEWQLTVSPPQGPISDDFVEREIVISGQASMLTNTYNSGYETIVLRFMIFPTWNCTHAPYLYVRLAEGNPRDFHDLLDSGNNTEIFDIERDRWEKFRTILDEAIRTGAARYLQSLR